MSIRKLANRGFSLIEVMIAVVVLSFGLLSLAGLQAELMRAGAEAKARANATAIAQQVIESARSFAFVTAPGADYEGDTYMSLASGNWTVNNVGGINYTVAREVRRYRYDVAAGEFVDQTATGDPFDASVSEFKFVAVTVSWSGNDGTTKTVRLTDSIAAVAPADAAQVVKSPSSAAQGPVVWIEPPGKGSSQVVPIAIGSDKFAASSNPQPQQFVNDVSSATLFSVLTFTGNPDGNEVQLNRRIDVAAVSCVCESDGSVSTATAPAYEPTVWNGKRMAYMAPRPAPTGKPIGKPVVSNADKEAEYLCTVCCRDHHDASEQALKVDPYRALVNGAHGHYGYKKKGGGGYQISAGLFPVGSDTGNEYVEACRLIRVDGLRRLAVDARQNDLTVAPLNAASPPTGFADPQFKTKYSAFVLDYVKNAIDSRPGDYPATAFLPPLPSDKLVAHKDVVAPSAITLSAAGDKRTLVSFGLYIDYLTEDTLFAYNCAKAENNTGDCRGYGDRDPLEFIPFYAVNVANLGINSTFTGPAELVAWRADNPNVVGVSNTQFKNGAVSADGGVAVAQAGSSATPVKAIQMINVSNSGLAGTAPVDPDDADRTGDPHNADDRSSYATDYQEFNKNGGGGNTPPTQYQLTVQPVWSDQPKNSQISVSVGGSVCSPCQFTPGVPFKVRISGFTTQQGKNVTDRQVCLPGDARISNITSQHDGSTNEFVEFNLALSASSNHTLTVGVILDSASCGTGPGLAP
ncbi:MAG TPA: prepilin-type N-terminal cleavage/methylation domain-containing protein [Lysobacter sp.]|nr:prepilin-type N-terminal cleavage/methylation domain-containing protein [Lysobacter sp.]